MIRCMSLVLGLAIAAPGLGATTRVEASWCSSPRPYVRPAPYFRDARVQLVSSQTVPRAMRMLAMRTIVPIDRMTYRRLLSRHSRPAGGRYFYLIRGGVMAPISMSDAQLPAYAQEAAYAVHEDFAPHSVRIVSLITSETRQGPRNYPLLIASTRRITSASTFCIGGR